MDTKQSIVDAIGLQASQCQTMDGSALLLAVQAWVGGISPHEELWRLADQHERPPTAKETELKTERDKLRAIVDPLIELTSTGDDAVTLYPPAYTLGEVVYSVRAGPRVFRGASWAEVLAIANEERGSR